MAQLPAFRRFLSHTTLLPPGAPASGSTKSSRGLSKCDCSSHLGPSHAAARQPSPLAASYCYYCSLPPRSGGVRPVTLPALLRQSQVDSKAGPAATGEVRAIIEEIAGKIPKAVRKRPSESQYLCTANPRVAEHVAAVIVKNCLDTEQAIAELKPDLSPFEAAQTPPQTRQRSACTAGRPKAIAKTWPRR